MAFVAMKWHPDTLMNRCFQSMNISLPAPLKRFVDEQIAAGGYSSASEYVRALIRGDGKRRAEQRLEALLLEGLEGQETPLTREDWAAIRKEALSRVAAHKKRTSWRRSFKSPHRDGI